MYSECGNSNSDKSLGSLNFSTIKWVIINTGKTTGENIMNVLKH